MHVAAMYSRTIEATFRGYAFNATTDMAYFHSQVWTSSSKCFDGSQLSTDLVCFQSQLVDSLDSLETIHNNLSLGSKNGGGVVAASVWTDPSYSVLQYHDTAPPYMVSRSESDRWSVQLDASILLSSRFYIPGSQKCRLLLGVGHRPHGSV